MRKQYSVRLFDAAGLERAGAVFPALSDGAAELEARSFAGEHSWAHTATIFCKLTGRRWSFSAAPSNQAGEDELERARR